MMKLREFGLYAQALLYAASGINHFAHKGFYVAIMPDHYSNPGALVTASGVAEILGGVGLLVPVTRRPAAIGLAAMLTVFFDVHVSMVRHPERFPAVPAWVLWGRLPLQVGLIAAALAYAREPEGTGDRPAMGSEAR